MDIDINEDYRKRKYHSKSKHVRQTQLDQHGYPCHSSPSTSLSSHNGGSQLVAIHRELRRRSRQGNRAISHLMQLQLLDSELLYCSSRLKSNPSWRSDNAPKFSPDTFVHANYQFEVADGSLSLEKSNPGEDQIVDWSSVEVVVCPVDVDKEGRGSCPICLDIPLAARVSRCGHIACLPCLMRYFDMGYTKCPLCLEPLMLSDLRSVRFQKRASSKVSDVLTMTLMKRSKTTLRIQPCNSCLPDPDVFQKVKYNRGIVETVGRDQAELEKAIERCECPITKTYLHKAFELVGENAELWQKRHEGGTEQSQNGLIRPENVLENENSEKNAQEEHTFYYQAEDGRDLFLHSINFRCLLSEFGSPQKFPHSISGRILEMCKYQQTEGTRQRFRFLRHIPLTTNFHICELDLGHMLSDAVIAQYAAELADRAKHRDQVALAELRYQQQLEKSPFVMQSASITASHHRFQSPELAPLTSLESFPNLTPPGSFSVPLDTSSPKKISQTSIKQSCWANVLLGMEIQRSSPILMPGRVQSAESDIQDDSGDAVDYGIETSPPLYLSPDDSHMVCFDMMEKGLTSSGSSKNSSGNPVNQKRRFKKLFSNSSTRGCR